MKRLLYALVLLTMLAALFGCAPQATPAPTEPPAAQPTAEPPTAAPPPATATTAPEPTAVPAEPVTITYWAFGSEGSAMSGGVLWADWYAKVFKEYEATHPGVKIDFALKGYDASGSTLVVDTAVAAGTPPDIYFDTKFRVKKYKDAKLLDDLSPALATEDVAAYDPAVFAGSKDGSALWSIPATGGYWNMIVNTTLFEKAGKSDLLPKAPDYTWTTEEFLNACKAINDPANNVYCTAFFAGSTSMDSATNEWLAAFPDCKFFDADAKQYTVNSPACVEAFTFLHSIYDQKLMVPGAAGLIDDTTDPYWLKQQVAILDQGNWYDSITKKGIADGSVQKFDYIFVQVPNKPGAPVTPVGMSNPDVWGMFKQADAAKQKAIYDLINYMQKPEIVAQIAEGWGKIPVRSDAPYKSDDPAVAGPLAAARKFGSYDPYFVNGVPCNYNDVRQAWAETRQAIWQDNADIQAILDEFVQRADDIIGSCK
jgi:ABC-type glycerol-3-phosphate transport system substrate-binding protein